MCLYVFKDRVVDDLNPALNFTRKEVESLLHFVEEEAETGKIGHLDSWGDLETILHQACQFYPHLITKVQFYDRCYSKSDMQEINLPLP